MKAEQQKQIADKIEGICRGIEETSTTAWDNIKRELGQIRPLLGDDFLDERFGHVPLVMHIMGKAPTKAVSPARVITLPQSVTSPAPAATNQPVRRRGRPKRQATTTNAASNGTLPFGETSEHVVAAVKRIGAGNEFRMSDVCDILHQQNIKFNPSYVSLVLSKGLKNVRKLGLRPNKTGRPSNVYLVSLRGTPALP